MEKGLKDEEGFTVLEKGILECMKVHGLKKAKER